MTVQFGPGAPGRGARAVESDSFENCCGAIASPWVRIPPSPPCSPSSMDRVPGSEPVDGRSIRPEGTSVESLNESERVE